MTAITPPIAPGAMRLRRSSTLRLMTAAGAVIIAALVAMPAVSADRLPDKDVMALLERIDNERDRFEDQLDGKIKNSIIQGAGEVHVERFLDDLQENVDRLKRGSTQTTRRVPRRRRCSVRARTSSASCPSSRRTSTARANGTDWRRASASWPRSTQPRSPFPKASRRGDFNDREVEKVASELAKSADQFKNDLESALKTNTTIDQPTKDAAVKEVNGLKEDAEKLASTVGDGRPASGEAKAVLDSAAKIRGAAASSGRTLSPAAQTAWGSVETGLEKVAVAFDLPARRP